MGRVGTSRGRMRAPAVVVIGVVASTLSLTACSETGESIASDRVAEVADRLGEALTPLANYWHRDADWLVATRIPPLNATADPGAPTTDVVVVEALEWSGSTKGKNGAVIDVRIRVEIPGKNAISIGDSSYSEGSATQCFRYSHIGYRQIDDPIRSDIPCPDGLAPALPTPTPLPALPKDAWEQLSAVLLAATSVRSATADLRRAFPQDYVTVDVAIDAGRLIASVGVPFERECIVGVRSVDGIVEQYGYRKIWIEPGETGCTTELVTNPPT